MPHAKVIFDEAGLGLTRDDILKRLRQGEPGIALAASGTNGVCQSADVAAGQERIICERLRALYVHVLTFERKHVSISYEE